MAVKIRMQDKQEQSNKITTNIYLFTYIHI